MSRDRIDPQPILDKYLTQAKGYSCICHSQCLLLGTEAEISLLKFY